MKNLKTPLLFTAFLAANFATLGIGNLFMSIDGGSSSDWYTSLNQAPWTPDGWVFGFAWSFLMICFALYMTFSWQQTKNKTQLLTEYAIQALLNIAWIPLFFVLHYTGIALFEIILLLITVSYMTRKHWHELSTKSVLIFPYIAWLMVAISLNGYVFLYN